MLTLTKNQTLAAVIGTLFAVSAFAADPAPEIQRDVNQQQRIEQGLKSDELNTREAARLEKGEARIDKMEQKALSDGKLSPAEKARIERAQNAESRTIYMEKHDAQKGNPNSASSQRMQADVHRNVNQEMRIEQGVQSGSLTHKEAAKLEGGQVQVDRKEARAGADGHISTAEQRRIQGAENRQSKRIYHKKHNEKTAGK
jgi:hypothetical protein